MIRLLPSVFCLLASLLISSPVYCLPSLQLFIDLTPSGGTLRPPAGTYPGPIVISKPITLDGRGQVTIDGGGKGTVLIIKADNSTIRGLHLTNSGNSHDALDAGLLLTADQALIEHNQIDEVLFGIVIQQANDNVIRDNRISSRKQVPSLRGESLRLWYSHGNLIEANDISRCRDLLLTNSPDNRIVGNNLRDSRISMEFVFSPDNEVRDNLLIGNDTGIVAIYSDRLNIESNHIEHIRNIGSSALAIKASSQVVIANNEILHNAVGLTANSPTEPQNILFLNGNSFTYNTVAMYFYGEKGGHQIHDNRFENNLFTVAVSAPMSARFNDWHGNYWEDYTGFDSDNDGFGDTPHEVWLYSDQVWMDRPDTSFFRGSLVMEVIDFIERLAPFSEPELILSDPTPRIRR